MPVNFLENKQIGLIVLRFGMFSPFSRLRILSASFFYLLRMHIAQSRILGLFFPVFPAFLFTFVCITEEYYLQHWVLLFQYVPSSSTAPPHARVP